MIFGIPIVLIVPYTIIILIIISITVIIYYLIRDNRIQVINIMQGKIFSINLFIILNILIYLYISNNNQSISQENIYINTVFISALFTITISIYKTFLNCKKGKGKVLSGRLLNAPKSIGNELGYLADTGQRFILQVEYNDNKGNKKIGDMISFYEKKGKIIDILINIKDQTKIYPYCILKTIFICGFIFSLLYIFILI